MPVGAFSTAGATGGVLGGGYSSVVNSTSGVMPYIDMAGTVKDTNRITYVTPRIEGIQFGVSFAESSDCMIWRMSVSGKANEIRQSSVIVSVQPRDFS